MGILDRVKFWKSGEEPLSNPPDYDLGARQFDMNPSGTPPMQASMDPNAASGYGVDPLAQHDPMQQGLTQQGDAMFGQEPRQQQYPQAYPQQYPGNTPFPGTMQQPAAAQYAPQDQHDHASGVQQRDIELILAKLDGIKSELDALHQRVRKIEQAYDAKDQQQKKYW